MTFPQRYARTQGFSLGAPRRFTVSPDGARLLFCRSRGGQDPVDCLWVYDVATGAERLLVDPVGLVDPSAPMSAEERTRRERARERSSGVTAYATDGPMRLAAFALSGRLWLADVDTGAVTVLPADGPVIDARPDPSGRTIAYVAGGALRVIDVDGAADRSLATGEGPDISYGLAEHVAAESMGRMRGYWWAPDGQRLIVSRVDNSQVHTWYLSNPAEPTAEPVAMRYPAAGTANADVSLSIIALDGGRIGVDWDRREYEYVTAVHWHETGLLVAVQNRAQTRIRLLTVDPDSGQTQCLREDTDAAWVSIVGGVPARTVDGALVWTADIAETRHLLVDGEPVTPPGLQVGEILDVDGDVVLFRGSAEPTETHVWTWSATSGLARLTDEPGVHDSRRGGGTTVITSRTLDDLLVRVAIRANGRPERTIDSYAETPPVSPRVELLRAGERQLRTVVLFPTGHAPGDGPLPVLLDPYAGPAGQRVVAARSAYLTSQWFADQGFAVVIADGRGTPGRGPVWERTIHHDRGSAPLQDQIDALHAAAQRYGDLDLSRVGIRGWSYGGYLAALAVLRRPDVFHAAVAGAAPADQRLYDTHWQERFLGHPDEFPDNYERSSLLAEAGNLSRPLMLIHGLLDDNVHPGNTMRLSTALLAAGRPHTVLPLATASHMTTTDDITANLLVLQAEFLGNALASPA